MKKSRSFLLVLLVMLATFSCNKDKLEGESQFYGRWKTDYGDTIKFFKRGGKNIIRYDLSMNPTMGMDQEREFAYIGDKLAIEDMGGFGIGYRKLESFEWLQQGHSFKLQGVEWMPFLSSTLTYFQFTKIP